MREVKYLSYSSFKVFEADPESFYRRYLADNRPPREPQNHYMAVGSAFDAFIKADLHKKFVDDGNPAFTRDALFETQVESHGRDEARIAGQIVYEAYIKHGAYKSLCQDMEGCINPRFEVDISAEIVHSKYPGSVTIFGKPDVMYITKTGARVIHDFKVNGYYSKAKPPARAGYIKLFPGMTMHKNASYTTYKGHPINGTGRFHTNCEDWAEQLSMYAWVMGEPIGSDYILSVDQMVCNSVKKEIQIAKHAGTCSDTWQEDLFKRVHIAWNAALSGHVFQNEPYDRSKALTDAIDAELGAEKDAMMDSMLQGKPKRFR